MPWTEILGGATGGIAAFIVAAFLVGRLVAEEVGEAATSIVDARLLAGDLLSRRDAPVLEAAP